jgi:hypothetical protein
LKFNTNAADEKPLADLIAELINPQISSGARGSPL